MIRDWRVALVIGTIFFVLVGLGNHFIDGL